MTTYTVTATATDAATDRITVSSATNMFSGLPIVFSGTAFGGITAGATYYIGTVVPGYPTSTITVTGLPGGAVVGLTTAAGTMTGTFNSGGQQIIDIGSAPNDGTGDPLRTAFNDTNVNFDQVFAAGPVGSNVQIANNTIKTINTNGNLVLAPNGTGVVQSNVTIVPNTANVRNLGSVAQRWSTIYTQYLDISGTLTTGDLTVDGNLTVQGNIIQVGNIVTETLTIQLANAASTANAANGSGITVGANDNIATLLYSSTSNTWTTNIGLSSVGNISAPYLFGNGSQLTGLAATYGNANVVANLAALGSNPVSTTGNITGGFIFGNISQANGFPATYGNANAVAYGESGWAGNIVPSGNAVYSLGNATNQWNDLYVSNATIFMNNVPVSLSAGNVLTVNGNAVLTNGSNTAVSTTGNITAGNIGITGGSLTWANASIVQTSASDVSITGDGQVTVRSLDGTYQWTFESTGNLTLPGATAGETIATQGGYITVGNLLVGQSGALFNSNNDSWALYGNLSDPGATILIPSNADAGNGTPLYIESQQSNVEIRSGSSTWNFDTTSNLTLPGNTFAVNYANGTQVSIGGGANTGNVTFDDNIVIGTGDEFGFSGLYLAVGPDSIANGTVQYLRVRGGDAPTHIHLDTGNNQFYDQYFGDDAKYVKLELGETGNVVIGTSDVNGNSYNWSFTSDGNLILADGNSVIQSIANSSLDPLNPNVSTMVLTPDPGYGSQALVLDPTAPGHIHLRALGANIDEPSANIFLGGEDSSFEVGYYDGAAPNVFVHSGGNTWTFGTDGILTFPDNLVIAGNTNVFGTNAALITSAPDQPLIAVAAGANGSVSSLWVEDIANVGTSNIAAVYANPTSGSKIVRIAVGQNGNAGPNLWDFDTAGNLTLPGNTFAVNYANGTAVSLGGSYGNANVATFLAAYGSNTISTTGSITSGNVTGGNVLTGGVVSATGNITGGNLSVSGNITGAFRVVTTPTGLANLSAVAGGRAFVNNANLVAVGNFGNQVGSGGSNIVPVWSDGSNWYIG